MDFKKNVNTLMNNYATSPKDIRLKAYDICHKFFIDNRKEVDNDEKSELMALHLYAFLASWGMVVRGNCMLQHNYKYLIPIIKELCKEKYEHLIDINIFSDDFKKENFIKDVLNLKDNLTSVFNNCKPTNTLLSKIILATLSCIPAYDTKVQAALKANNYRSNFNKDGLISLLKFANKYKEDILQLKNYYQNVTEIDYPIMKYIDMALWI